MMHIVHRVTGKKKFYAQGYQGNANEYVTLQTSTHSWYISRAVEALACAAFSLFFSFTLVNNLEKEKVVMRALAPSFISLFLVFIKENKREERKRLSN